MLLGFLTSLRAQDMYLPVSSKSETAKSDYFKALQAAENANIPAFFIILHLKSAPRQTVICLADNARNLFFLRDFDTFQSHFSAFGVFAFVV